MSWLFGHVEKRLDWKAKVSIKTYDVTIEKQTIVMHILSNIPRRKGNQKMKFRQLIDYKIRNNFLEKSYTRCGGETITRPFYKKSKLKISLDQQFEVLCSLFLLYEQLTISKIYWNWGAKNLILLNLKLF